MGNVITLVVCFGLVLLLLGFLIFLIKGLFSFGRNHVKATAQYIRHPETDEAVEFLKSRAVDGKVTRDDFMEARERLVAKGMPENEVLSFLMHNLQLMGMDADRKHRHINKAKRRIRDIEKAQLQVGTIDFDLAAEVRKSELEDEIKVTEQQLHLR